MRLFTSGGRVKSGAEGGPIEISGTAKAGNGSRQFRFEVARLFPLLFRVVLFTSIAQLLGPWLLALLVKDGGFGVVKPKSNPSNRFDGVWVAFSGHIVRQASSWTAAGNFSLEAGAASESG